MRWLWPFFRPRLPALLACEGLLLAAVGLSLLNSRLVAVALDVHVAGHDGRGLFFAAAGYAVFVVLAGATSWRARVGIEEIAQDAMRRLKETLFAHLVAHDLALHDELPPGRLVSRVNGDTEALRILFTEVVLQLPGDAALFGGLLVILTLTAPTMAAVVAATIPLYLVLIVWFRRVSPSRFTHAREVSARLSGFIAEHIRALPLLRAYDRLGWLDARSRALGEEKFTAEVDAGMLGCWFFNAIFAVRALGYAGILWAGALGVESGVVTVGVLVMTLDFARKMFEPFIRLQFHVLTLERARAGATRIRELLDRVPTIRSPASPAPWPGGELRLDGVSFSYKPDEPVLRDISMSFAPGSRVALVGATGSGKSTVVSLLFRFRDPDAGAVSVGGRDLRTLDPMDLRSHIGLVPQGVHLLPGTVAENLGVDDARAAALLDEVGLSGRVGPATRVGEGGEGLSRGEAQLLCFARAIAPEPSVLVLDEATAAMDPATEARIAARIAARPDRTIITVAHRLRTIEGCDCIYVMALGRLVEAGTHGELLKQGGAYAGLWRAQLAAEGSA